MNLQPWLLEPWRQLQARRAAGRMPHALMLAAPAGLGKRALADALLASMLCETPKADGFACGHCRGCSLLASGTHADAMRISFGLRDDGKLRSEIVVDQIRDLSARFAQTSARGGWRVAIIDPANAMNHNAANALLKTLEEPEPNVLMMLVGDELARLPATIRSRCQRVEILMPATADARTWLLAQGVADADVDVALELADGNPGEAMQLATTESRRLIASLVADLALIANGSELAPIAARWNDDDAELRLRTMARLITAALRPGAQTARKELRALADLIAPADFLRLSQCWDRLNAARLQLSTPLRSDLLILDVLGQFRDALN